MTAPTDAAHAADGPIRAVSGRVFVQALAVGLLTLALIAVGGPLMALAALVVVGAGLAVAWRADIATVLFAFLFYANVLVVASRFHGVPSALASTAVLILLFPLVRSIVIERQRVVITATTGLMFVFLIAMMLSAITSTATRATLGPIGNYALEGIVLYLIISNVANTPERVASIIRVLVFAAFAMALLSVFQELSGTHDNNYLGFAQVSDGGFEFEENSEELRTRLAGPIGEQNRYAQVLLMVVPLAYFMGRPLEKSRARFLWSMAALVISAGVLLTFSRGAAVAAFVLLVGMMLHRYISVGRVIAILAVMGAVMVTIAPEYTLRLTSLAGVTSATEVDSDADGAIKGRTTEALAAWNVFTAHPITGVGPDRFFREFSRIEANKLGLKHLDTNRRSHNLYLEIAADLGLVGLLSFIAIMATTLLQLMAAQHRWRDRDPAKAALAAGLMFALYSYVITAVFLQLSYQRYLWAMVALANGAIWSLREQPVTITPISTSGPLALEARSGPDRP